MEYYVYSILFVLGISFVALLLMSCLGPRDKEGCAEVKSVRTPEALQDAA